MMTSNLPLDQQAFDFSTLNNLYVLQSILQNMKLNIGLIQQGTIGKVLTVTNANLFQIAAQEYGDATQWTTIANANGLTDPMIEATMSASINNYLPGFIVISLSGIPASPQSITFTANGINYTYNISASDTINTVAENMSRLVANTIPIENIILFPVEQYTISPNIIIERIVNLVIPQQIGLPSGGILSS